MGFIGYQNFVTYIIFWLRKVTFMGLNEKQRLWINKRLEVIKLIHATLPTQEGYDVLLSYASGVLKHTKNNPDVNKALLDLLEKIDLEES